MTGSGDDSSCLEVAFAPRSKDPLRLGSVQILIVVWMKCEQLRVLHEISDGSREGPLGNNNTHSKFRRGQALEIRWDTPRKVCQLHPDERVPLPQVIRGQDSERYRTYLLPPALPPPPPEPEDLALDSIVRLWMRYDPGCCELSRGEVVEAVGMELKVDVYQVESWKEVGLGGYRSCSRG